MPPLLILVRHGNTFEADQTPTFVGGRTDHHLTRKGEEQGEAIAKMIAVSYTPLSAIISGPLRRTKRFAEVIGSTTNTVFTIDERLTEIDYGLWENKTTDDVKALFGTSIVESWEKDGAWPQDMNWAPSEEKLIRNVESLLAEQYKKITAANANNRVIITSNGILRYVYKSITSGQPDSAAKVKTGNYCVIAPTANGGWEIIKWNEKPD